MPSNYDVIIIGSGAGGGTLARQLAPTGKRILILERGDWLKREALNWDAKAVFVDNRYISGAGYRAVATHWPSCARLSTVGIAVDNEGKGASLNVSRPAAPLSGQTPRDVRGPPGVFPIPSRRAPPSHQGSLNWRSRF